MKKMINFDLNNKLYINLIEKLLFIVIVTICIRNGNRLFNGDEIESIHTAWKILNGETIYKDFFQHHHPLSYVLTIPFIKIFGETIHAIKAIKSFYLLIFLGILGSFYLNILKYLKNKKLALVSVLLLLSSTIFLEKGIQVRPDSISLLFCLLSFYKYDLKNNSNLIQSSFLLSLAFFCSQKIIFIILVLVFFQAYDFLKNRQKKEIYKILNYWLFFLLMLLIFLSYFGLTSGLKNYFLFNWSLNNKYVVTRNFFQNGHLILLKDFLLQNKLISFFFICNFYNFKQKINYLIIVLVFLNIFFSSAQGQSYLFVLPIICFSAASFLEKLEVSKFLKLVLLLACLGPFINTSQHYLSQAGKYANNKQIEMFAYTLAHSDKSDYFYDSENTFNLFRKDIDFFWFSTRNDGALQIFKSITNYNYNIADLFYIYKPKFFHADNIPDNDYINIIKDYNSIPNLVQNIYERRK
jgi:hypothetical protein